jgi:hypothetical protein
MQVSKQIGWSQESNLLYQILKQLNQLTSVIFGLKPKYKVYTALLTQSGGDNTQSYYGGESLTIGTTYRITGIDDGDFTIVGAPNNNINTQFVATGTTPNWGTLGENVLEYNTGAPVATVLENTIGNIWWSYNGVNQFEAKSNDLFTEDKTILFIQGSNDGDTSSASILNNLYHIDSDTINCIVSLGGNLNKTSIEIRVYN